MNTLVLVLASTLTLTAPDNGATYDTHTPWVNEFLSHPAERSVKPEEPPLSQVEIKRRDEDKSKTRIVAPADAPAAIAEAIG